MHLFSSLPPRTGFLGCASGFSDYRRNAQLYGNSLFQFNAEHGKTVNSMQRMCETDRPAVPLAIYVRKKSVQARSRN